MSASNITNRISPNLSHRVMIRLTPCQFNFVVLQTYTPEHGRSQRFFMDKNALLSMLSGEKHSFIDSDLSNYLHLRFDGSVMQCKAVWLSVNACDAVSGHVQRFGIPASVLHKALSGQETVYIAHTNEPLSKAKLSFSDTAQKAIRHYSEDKLTRRALSKFFRDNFNYGPDEQINIYDDAWADGFYICSPVTGFNGGIILHKGTVQHYGFPKLSFSLHT